MRGTFKLTVFGLAIFLATVVSAGAVPYTFDIEGTISQFSIFNLPDYGIAVGDSFTGTLSYELFGQPPTGEDAYYILGNSASAFSDGYLLLQIQLDGLSFRSSSVNSVHIADSSSGDAFSIQNGGGVQAGTPWIIRDSWLVFSLLDNSGSAVSSLGLPEQLNAGDWADAHYFEFSGYGGTREDPQQFTLRGEITSFAAVPDSGDNRLLFTFAVAPLLVFGTLRRRKQVSF